MFSKRKHHMSSPCGERTISYKEMKIKEQLSNTRLVEYLTLEPRLTLKLVDEASKPSSIEIMGSYRLCLCKTYAV